MDSFPDSKTTCCSVSNPTCCFLTCIQVSQEAGKAVCYSLHLRIFQQCVVIHTIKGFGVVNKTEVDVFLKLSYFFHDPTDFGDLISGSSAFSKFNSNIWKFTVHILLGLACRILTITLLTLKWVQVCGSSNILSHCLSLGLEWKLPFSSPVATDEFSKYAGILSATLSPHHLLEFEIAPLEFHHLH